MDANFNDILAAVNALDAGNLASGTVPLARISGLTSSQCAAAFFKDEDAMTSDSATAVASQQSVKAYVAANHPTYSGGESHADGSGLIIKFGLAESTTDGDQNFSFDIPFPSACVAAHLTRRDAEITIPAGIKSIAADKFVVNRANAMNDFYFYWMAIGY